MKSKLQTLLEKYKYKAAADKKLKDLLRYRIEGEIFTMLSSTIDRYSEHLKYIVITVSTLMQSERVSLMVRKGNFLEISASHGLPESALQRESLIRVGTGIAGKVAETGQPIFTGDLTRNEDLKQSSIGGPGFKSNAFICLPLKVDGNVLGVINVSNPIEGTSYRKSDFNFLEKVADKIALLLHKSMKFESMRHELGHETTSLPPTLQSIGSGTHMDVKKDDDLSKALVKAVPPPLPPQAKKK
jgi:transcriptional regulator with GAF, ATPase, and Fis domain